MEEKVQNALLNSSGGNFDNFLHKIFSSSILYYITIPINILVDKIVKFPTTTVPKGILNFFFHVWSESQISLNQSSPKKSMYGVAGLLLDYSLLTESCFHHCCQGDLAILPDSHLPKQNGADKARPPCIIKSCNLLLTLIQKSKV